MSNLYSRLVAGVIGGLAALVVACGPGSEDTKDAGSDACISCSKPDANYLPDASIPDAGCNSNCYVDGGEGADAGPQYDAGGNLVHLIIESQDSTGNVRGSTETGTVGSFRPNENMFFDLNKSYRENCGDGCGQSKGMDYCDWSTAYVSGDLGFPPEGSGRKRIMFVYTNRIEIFRVTCYSFQGESAESSIAVNITD